MWRLLITDFSYKGRLTGLIHIAAKLERHCWLSPVKWTDAHKRTVLEVTTHNVISWVIVPAICTLESRVSFPFIFHLPQLNWQLFFHLSSKVINKAHCSLNIWFLSIKSKTNFSPEKFTSWAESTELSKTPILQCFNYKILIFNKIMHGYLVFEQ